jgi:thiosulfate reductase/polysulfide reductase chain A
MSTKFNRREFIKITGAGTGAAVAGGTLYNVFAQSDAPAQSTNGQVTKTPTYCEICFWKCAGWTYAVDGKPWKLIGNDRDPNCNGRLCPRVTGGIGAYTDSERWSVSLCLPMVPGVIISKIF